MLNGGYFDLATPFYEGWYEMHHLPIPQNLQDNIEYHYYQSGHMVYAQRSVAEGTARQRRRLHPQDRQFEVRPI